MLLRSDVERKVLFGVSETERLPPEAYGAASTRKVMHARDKAQRVIAAGHSAIVDAVFAALPSAPPSREVGGVRFSGLFLTADLATRLERIGHAETMHPMRMQPSPTAGNYDLGTIEWTKVDASGTPDDTMRHARAR